MNTHAAGSPESPLVRRIFGLALVLLSLCVFYGLTLPGGPWSAHLLLGSFGVTGTFVGMPLFVTGRIRQTSAG
jgi:hypothetical protein